MGVMSLLSLIFVVLSGCLVITSGNPANGGGHYLVRTANKTHLVTLAEKKVLHRPKAPKKHEGYKKKQNDYQLKQEQLSPDQPSHDQLSHEKLSHDQLSHDDMMDVEDFMEEMFSEKKSGNDYSIGNEEEETFIIKEERPVMQGCRMTFID